jgi:hypothetical protein
MALSFGPIYKLQHCSRCSSREHCDVVYSRKHLQELESVYFVVMDPRKTCIVLPFLSILMLTDLLDHSRCWQKRTYVRHPPIHFGLHSLYYGSSAIVQDINDMCNAGSAHRAFFFFDCNDVAKQDARALLSSVIVQLTNQSNSFYDILLRFHATHGCGTQQPGIDALLKCLEDILKASGDVPIYLIIDAVDECPNTTGMPSARDHVLSLVEKLVKLNLPSLHLCITGRPEIDIQVSLENLTSPFNSISLHEQDGQRKDIADFVRAVVYSDKNMRRWRDEDKELVIVTLSERADGM